MFRERLHKGYAQSMELTGVVVEQKSRYQRIKIFDTVANGRVMVLDDIVQITTRDESAYAEMLTHLPLLEHGKGERVMIVGGGDLSIADEALKHRTVKEVVLVDIDGRVVELCREHFGAINAKAFKDKRLTIEIADAFEYLGRKEAKARFDLIVADRPDPVGPGKALFGDTFYARVKGALRPGGFATFQTGVPFYQPWEITEALNDLAAYFPQSGLYLTVVPTYVGGFMALSWAGMDKPLGTPAGIRRAAEAQRWLRAALLHCRPWSLSALLGSGALHQLQTNAASDNRGCLLQGSQCDVAIAGVEKAMHLRAAGLHRLSHPIDRDALRFHPLLELERDLFFDDKRRNLVIDAFFLEKLIERRADMRVPFALCHFSTSFMRSRATARSADGVRCVFLMNPWSTTANPP